MGPDRLATTGDVPGCRLGHLKTEGKGERPRRLVQNTVYYRGKWVIVSPDSHNRVISSQHLRLFAATGCCVWKDAVNVLFNFSDVHSLPPLGARSGQACNERGMV